MMKHIIREELLRIFERNILNEASKMNILIEKEGLDEEQARILDTLCGPLSVWMLSKFKQYQKDIFKSWEKDVPIDQIVVERIVSNKLIKTNKSMIQSIMDWIRVGLNGNVKPFKDLSLKELGYKSKEWHESLDIGSGDINYIEENPIILDFRGENGEGFYWADLETQNSPEECDRMGHCGRSTYGYLYSLRSVKALPGGKFKLNKSHLTASIGRDGILYQLKGPKNSKPKDEYHKLILPLFYVEDDGEYLIQGFGTEYASQEDFKLSDLPDAVIRKIYDDRAELFSTRSLKRKLMDMGIIEKDVIDYKFKLEINPSDVSDYIKGDYLVSRRRKNKDGNYVGRDIGLFEAILSGDIFDIYDNWDADWELALKYYVNSENYETIKDILKLMVVNNNPDFDEDEFDSTSIDELIEEYDEDYEIRNSISNAVNNAEQDDYYKHIKGNLRNALEEYGVVEKMNDEGVILHINFEDYMKNIDDDIIDEAMDRCDDDVKCVFNELLGDENIDKPEFDVDERWSPDVDRKYFNEILEDNLSDIEYRYSKK